MVSAGTASALARAESADRNTVAALRSWALMASRRAVRRSFSIEVLMSGTSAPRGDEEGDGKREDRGGIRVHHGGQQALGPGLVDELRRAPTAAEPALMAASGALLTASASKA